MKRSVILGGVLLVLAGALPVLAQQSNKLGGEKRLYRLALPSKDWALDVEIPAPTEILEDTGDGGRERSFRAMYLKNQQPLFLTIQLTPALAEGGGAQFRDYAAKRLRETKRVRRSDFDGSEYKQFQVARYRINEESYPGGVDQLMRYMNIRPPSVLAAYLAKEDTWLELSVSSQSIKTDEEGLFYSLLDSVKLIDTSAPTSSFDYYQKGRPLYLIGNKKLFDFYTKAFEIERRERQMDAAQWRMLIRELANAYLAMGDAGKAQEVLDHGLTNDATYSWFHYYMAQVYASRDDLDNTVASLKTAFMNKPAKSFSDKLPHPAYDPRFERFRKNDKFRKAANKMNP